MTRNVTRIMLLIILLTFAALARADFSLPHWQFIKGIQPPETDVSKYVRVRLDDEVAKTGNNFTDVRVIADGNIEVPYQLIVEKASQKDSYYLTRMIDKSISSDGAAMFILDLGKVGQLHSRINIATAKKNFRRQVSVYASDELISHSDKQGWRLLTDKGYIYKFTDDRAKFKTGSGIVNYPESTAKYLRVVIDNGKEGSIDVSGANVYLYQVSSAKENTFTWPVTVTRNIEAKSTEIVIDLGSKGLHSHKVKLSSDSIEFSRRVVIQKSHDGEKWSKAGQGYIFILKTPKFSGANMTVKYPEVMARYLRVIIFNEDNSPLSIAPQVILSSIVRTVVFKYEPGSSYALYYGSNKADSPKYDLARFFKYLEVSDMLEVKSGAEKLNPAFVPEPELQPPFTERYPYLLNGVLIILVVIVALFIYFYIRPSLTPKDKA
jgi:hypothetical protein